MSRLSQRPAIAVDVTIKLTEAEMRALLALTVYGSAPFLKHFKAYLGSELDRHEDGIKSLFSTVCQELPPILARADNARRAFALDRPVIRSQEDHDALVDRIHGNDAELAAKHGITVDPHFSNRWHVKALPNVFFSSVPAAMSALLAAGEKAVPA